MSPPPRIPAPTRTTSRWRSCPTLRCLTETIDTVKSIATLLNHHHHTVPNNLRIDLAIDIPSDRANCSSRFQPTGAIPANANDEIRTEKITTAPFPINPAPFL
ncbi:hypothetical protein Hypma_012602 [Hypsizygus marmoreus]|uniref:Uncharacterized protein n=1 Tax=Hypsizygus marmoreus TaxID=39966 RepID=A0A369JIV4_HYPMA|nr:hypothetical protein Hypma_012602 [Hypsizygus marmoreus]